MPAPAQRARGVPSTALPAGARAARTARAPLPRRARARSTAPPAPQPPSRSHPQYLKSKGISGVKFLFNGEEVNRDDSPEDLNINDGDELEAIMMQTGGC